MSHLVRLIPVFGPFGNALGTVCFICEPSKIAFILFSLPEYLAPNWGLWIWEWFFYLLASSYASGLYLGFLSILLMFKLFLKVSSTIGVAGFTIIFASLIELKALEITFEMFKTKV